MRRSGILVRYKRANISYRNFALPVSRLRFYNSWRENSGRYHRALVQRETSFFVVNLHVIQYTHHAENL